MEDLKHNIKKEVEDIVDKTKDVVNNDAKRITLADLSDKRLLEIKQLIDSGKSKVSEKEYERLLREIQRRKERNNVVELSNEEMAKIQEMRERNAGKVTVEENKNDSLVEKEKDLQERMNRLSEQERTVISMRYGKDGVPAMFVEDVAEKLNLSTDEVKKVEQEALDKMFSKEKMVDAKDIHPIIEPIVSKPLKVEEEDIIVADELDVNKEASIHVEGSHIVRDNLEKSNLEITKSNNFNTELEDAVKESVFDIRFEEIMSSPVEPLREDYQDLNNEEWARVRKAWDLKYKDAPVEKLVSNEVEEETAIYNRNNIYVEEKPKKSKWWLWLLLLLLLLGLLFGWLYNRNKTKAMEKSYNDTKEALVVETTIPEGSTPVIEAGEQLTYSPSDDKEIEKIPDQFRPYIASLPKGANIECSPIDTNIAGEQDLVFTLKTEDKYGQKVENTQIIPIEIKDTVEPSIELKASSISAKADEALDEIKKNIASVVDPVFGAYRYSEGKENGTYSIDVSEVDFNNKGTYPVNVVIYDNGNQIVQSFDITITDAASSNSQESPSANQNSTNNNSQNNSQANQNANQPEPEPFVYVDQYGNKYTQSQVDAMQAGQYQIVDEQAYSENGAKSAEEEGCYASGGTWSENKCSWETYENSDSSEPTTAE